MTSLTERRERKIVQAIIIVAVVSVAAFAIGIPTLTDDESDADMPNFDRTWTGEE